MRSPAGRERVETLISRIETAQRWGTPLSPTDALDWAMAVHHYFELGDFESARFVAANLPIAGTELPLTRTLRRALEVIPPQQNQLPFLNNGRREIQIVRRAGAKTAILVFSDVNHSVGLPFATLHRWFGRLDATIIYLRDLRNLWFTAGLRIGLQRRSTTVRFLRWLVRMTGAERLICFGNSSGGFSAVQYGIDLGAETVVSMGGRTDLASIRSGRWLTVREHAEVQELQKPLSESRHPPKVLMVCGDGAWDDRLQADRIADLPSVQVSLVRGFAGHAVTVELLCREQFDKLLDWMQESAAGAVAPAPEFSPVDWAR